MNANLHAAVLRGALAVVLALTCGRGSLAGSATLTCTAPNNTFAETVVVTITYPDGKKYVVKTTITPGMTADQKAKAIATEVDKHKIPNWRVDHADGSQQFTIKDLPKGAVVEFDPKATGEAADKITVASAVNAAAHFQGHFDPFGYDGQPAIFTAGIVTDVGELTVQISAQELNFQTDGPIICQALFQRLAPHAPQYGGQVNYAGDRLEVYFDPAYSVTQGGIIFGTTSPSIGCRGQLLVPQSGDCNNNGIPDDLDILDGLSSDCDGNFQPDECDLAWGDLTDNNGNGTPDKCEERPGDLNCDGHVNFKDIDPFVAALGGQAAYENAYPTCRWLNADTNGDGQVTFKDIDPFVGLLGT